MASFHILRCPTVAVLALALAMTLAACADVTPPFTTEGTGDVEGFLFLDANEDQVFDPSDGDEGLAGVGVAARVRSTDDVLATATTGANGRFTLEGLGVGTIEVFFNEDDVPDGVFVCQNPVQATVFVEETTFTEVAARPACLVDIVDVQETAQPGDFVIVEGIVTAFPGQFDEDDGVIQDETGGIWLFNAPTGAGLEVGDLVELGGTVTLAVESLQLEGVEIRNVVKGVGAPDPVEVTTGEIASANDPRDPLQNMLVTVRGAELLTEFAAGAGRNANIDDGTGQTIIRVESVLSSSSGGGILETMGMTIGNCYDITGIVGAFFGDAQIFPRTTDDVVEVACD